MLSSLITGGSELRASRGDEEQVQAAGEHDQQPGESLRLRGRWTSHPQYGRQFQVDTYQDRAAGDDPGDPPTSYKRGTAPRVGKSTTSLTLVRPNCRLPLRCGLSAQSRASISGGA